MITKQLLQEKIDDVQHQVNTLRWEGDHFRPHVNKQVERIDQIYEQMATKEALSKLDAKFEARFDAVDDRFEGMDARFDRMDAKFDRMTIRLDDHGAILTKIAQKLGVST